MSEEHWAKLVRDLAVFMVVIAGCFLILGIAVGWVLAGP